MMNSSYPSLNPETSLVHPCCLTIAGSDSGGNAGVQADLRAFHAYGLHGCTAFAALTAQNPFGVSAVHLVPPEFLTAQLQAVLGVYHIRGIKTGMLAESPLIEVVAEELKKVPEIPKVIDPVMIATSGARLISESAVKALQEKLLPLATVITPNLPEAECLTGRTLKSRSEKEEGARMLYDQYGCSVLLKGGHASENEVAADILFDGTRFYSYELPWIPNPVSTHGTGCSFAAALAAELALGHPLPEAVEQAKYYVYQAIRNSYLVGENRCGVLGFSPMAVRAVPNKN